jgi:hypothetical protein
MCAIYICSIQIKSTLRFAVSIEWLCTLLSYHATKGYYRLQYQKAALHKDM